MTIYVDKIQEYPPAMCRGLPGNKWCHLISDSNDAELHAFAARIGMRRSWFQAKSTPHYDLVPSKREAAVKLGAVEVERNEFVAAIRRRRTAK